MRRPEEIIRLKDIGSIREGVSNYLMDNAAWRAEDRDLVWSQRLLAAKLSLLQNQTMTFQALVDNVRNTLLEAPAPLVRSLTPELIAEQICTSLTV